MTKKELENEIVKFWDEYLEEEFGMDYEECLEEFFTDEEYEDLIM